jgi:hypothetical protein
MLIAWKSQDHIADAVEIVAWKKAISKEHLGIINLESRQHFLAAQI